MPVAHAGLQLIYTCRFVQFFPVCLNGPRTQSLVGGIVRVESDIFFSGVAQLCLWGGAVLQQQKTIESFLQCSVSGAALLL